jgi:hypothetical protein
MLEAALVTMRTFFGSGCGERSGLASRAIIASMNGHDILVSLFSSLVGIVIAGVVAALTGLPKKWVDSVIDNRFKLKQDELNRAHQAKLSQLNH